MCLHLPCLEEEKSLLKIIQPRKNPDNTDIRPGKDTGSPVIYAFRGCALTLLIGEGYFRDVKVEFR